MKQWGIKSCQSCQTSQSNPAATPLHPWVWTDTPWKRIHVDYAGPFLGHMLFIAVDAHSKWPEVEMMSSTTSEKTIESLRSMFACHGLPEQLVLDNGPQFTSTEFSEFMKSNRIKHILSAPYHPATNGLAERFVQTLKRTLKAGEREGKTLHHVWQNSFPSIVQLPMLPLMCHPVNSSENGNCGHVLT